MALIEDIRFIEDYNIPVQETIVVDTNILLFHYNRATQVDAMNQTYQAYWYPRFLKKLIENKNRLLTTYLNLAEFCSVVERNEFKIYNSNLSRRNRLNLKEFRDLGYERNIYTRNVKRGLLEINQYIDDVYEITHDYSVVNSFIQALPETHCDIADYTVIEYMKSLGITNFISDDKDFTTVDGITLYTTYKDSHYQTQTADDRSSSTNSGRSDTRSNSTNLGRSDGRRSNTNLNRLNVFSSSRPQSRSQSH